MYTLSFSLQTSRVHQNILFGVPSFRKIKVLFYLRHHSSGLNETTIITNYYFSEFSNPRCLKLHSKC